MYSKIIYVITIGNLKYIDIYFYFLFLKEVSSSEMVF